MMVIESRMEEKVSATEGKESFIYFLPSGHEGDRRTCNVIVDMSTKQADDALHNKTIPIESSSSSYGMTRRGKIALEKTRVNTLCSDGRTSVNHMNSRNCLSIKSPSICQSWLTSCSAGKHTRQSI
jgi:hypothetical protein